jgi:hypothetical protein
VVGEGRSALFCGSCETGAPDLPRTTTRAMCRANRDADEPSLIRVDRSVRTVMA